jgi:hypothetical protein
MPDSLLLMALLNKFDKAEYLKKQIENMKKIMAALCLIATLSVHGQSKKISIHLTYDDSLQNKLVHEKPTVEALFQTRF